MISDCSALFLSLIAPPSHLIQPDHFQRLNPTVINDLYRNALVIARLKRQ